VKISEMTDNTLVGEAMHLAYCVEELGCFNTNDVMRLEMMRRELEARGFEETMTAYVKKEADDD